MVFNVLKDKLKLKLMDRTICFQSALDPKFRDFTVSLKNPQLNRLPSLSETGGGGGGGGWGYTT